MKKNFLSWLFISLFMAAGLSACDDDDDDDNIVVAFPEKLETITANAGETKQISFKTSAAWTLTSSELWCTFGKSGEYSLSGTAGEQTVSINVSDLYQSNAEKSVLTSP